MPQAWLLGTPGRFPFVGHLRVERGTPAAGWAIAARVSWQAGVADAFGAARGLEAGLLSLPADPGAVDTAVRLFRGLASPEEASILGLRWHDGGVRCFGWGLTALQVDGEACEPMGASSGFPWIKTPPGDRWVGVPAPHELEGPWPEDKQLAARCGVHP